MKRFTSASSTALLALTFAAATPFCAQAAPKRALPQSDVCAPIRAACEKAGFRRGGHNLKKRQRKGLYQDCLQKILDGETVKGVTATTDMIVACKQHRQ